MMTYVASVALQCCFVMVCNVSDDCWTTLMTVTQTQLDAIVVKYGADSVVQCWKIKPK